MSVFFEFFFILGYSFSAGTKTISKIKLLLEYCTLVLSFFLCIAFFFIYALLLFYGLFCFCLCFLVDFSPFLFCIFLGWFLPLVLGFLLPFIETQRIASNQSCLCRTVIFNERDYRQETWSTIGSNSLQIFSLLNRDGEDEHGCSTSNGGVSATRDSTSNDNVSCSNGHFLFDPWTLEIQQLDP